MITIFFKRYKIYLVYYLGTKMSNVVKSEKLLTPDENRYVMFPIQYNDVWEMYKRQMECFWRAEEVDLSKDLNDWKRLTSDAVSYTHLTLPTKRIV